MGAQQSSRPGTWSIQSTDAAGNPVGDPISGTDSLPDVPAGAYNNEPDYGHSAEIGAWFGDVFGTIGSGISDVWSLAKDGATVIIHFPKNVIDDATNIAHEAGTAVKNLGDAGRDIFSSPILLIGGAAVLLIALK